MSSSFSNLPINKDMLDNISSLGYSQMTPIQEKTLADILNNKDVLAQAKTGSGKTAAFAIGLLSKIDIKSVEVQALVICPTRELSDQVCKEIRKLARSTPNLRIKTLCGGAPMAAQKASLKHGVHCVVGTPGRINDHIRKGTLQLENCQTLVFDEADRMLEMGFFDTMRQIVGHTPKSRQTLLFSATYPDHIEELSTLFQRNAVRIKVDTDAQSLPIEELFFQTSNSKKFYLLEALLVHYKPQSSLIFCNTKHRCQELADALRERGFFAQALHGDLEQRERDEALILFANKSNSILVATDVAARGIDINDLQAVINFELSPHAEVHVHRVGRTGRAGKKGLALSLYSEQDQYKLEAIESYYKKALTYGETSELNFADQTRIKAPMATLRISSGRKNKLRAGDILGALTADTRIAREDVGKIDVFDLHSFVAVAREKIGIAYELLYNGKIKGNHYKVMMLCTQEVSS